MSDMTTQTTTFDVHYEGGGHSYKETWKKTEYFCPCCGTKAVWQRPDGGDYYQGETFLCVDCETQWNWPNEPSDANDFQYIQRLKEIGICQNQ